ncbi:hypothetical protein [Pedobacter sp. GR22-10]|uniref:hypothetical protein n=1 Tax=Pedobacter sp. GR22-10 TaxID=2994472 RepID=UPI0022477B99|nr:hypothetical protein [Pedobacter sp. GR22-10]MCX2429886.1 hypothetical protein [Pedobacter sp. GR22-10]
MAGGLSEYYGIPSKEAVDQIQSTLVNLTNNEKEKLIQHILSSDRDDAISKQIYSTYKAASYFVNFAKDKFKLIGSRNELSEAGEQLLSLRSSAFNYSESEKLFFFNKILETDFLLFVSLCKFIRIGKKYNYKDYVDLQFDFLDEYYGIKHFNFTSASLGNYNAVRNHWIQALSILDKKKFIKKKYLKIITLSPIYQSWLLDVEGKILLFESDSFKEILKYRRNKDKFEKRYTNLLKLGKGDLGFVNLYDIKSVMVMSYESFDKFLNTYYEHEKRKKHIFFSNIVNSIDGRKRFNVRNVPVLKVKIK